MNNSVYSVILEFVTPLLVAAVGGLVRWIWSISGQLNEFKVHVAEEYASRSVIATLKADLDVRLDRLERKLDRQLGGAE